MALTKWFIVLAWLIFPLGQFAKPFFDIAILCLVLSSLPTIKLNKFSILFLIVAVFSFIQNQLTNPLSSEPILYLIRLFCLVFLLNIKPLSTATDTPLKIAWFTSIAFGFIQYVFYPNTTYLAILGWDPHLNRLIGSFFDPTFTGLIYLLFIIYFFVNKYSLWYIIPTYIGLALTYSRSSMLALAVVSCIYSIKLKKPAFLVVVFAIISGTVLLLPKTEGEGTNLQRTSTITAKLENYREAFSYLAKKPLLGHGYNFLINSRKNMGHASSGFDSSLLTIAVTTGVAGLLFFILILKSNYNYFLLAVLTHSLFSNSLLYPWVYFLLFALRIKYHKL